MIKPATDTDLRRLQIAIADMHSLAEDGFHGAIGIANLSRLALRDPSPANLDWVTKALGALATLADVSRGCIQGEAQSVGCFDPCVSLNPSGCVSTEEAHP
jgi:hypothetical protein